VASQRKADSLAQEQSSCGKALLASHRYLPAKADMIDERHLAV